MGTEIELLDDTWADSKVGVLLTAFYENEATNSGSLRHVLRATNRDGQPLPEDYMQWKRDELTRLLLWESANE